MGVNKNFPNLKYYREALGLTQQEIACMLNCYHNHYSFSETGRFRAPKFISRVTALLESIENKRGGLNYNSLKVMRCMCGLSIAKTSELLSCSYATYRNNEIGKCRNIQLINKARDLFQNILENKKCS